MMRITALSLFAIILLAACSSTNPVLEQKILEWHGRSSSQMYDGKGLFRRPMPLAVGQFTVMRSIKGDDRALLRSAIVGKEGNGWIFETQSTNASSESTMQMFLTGVEAAFDNQDPDMIGIEWVKMKNDDGKVMNIDGAVLSLTKSRYKNLLNGLYLKFANDEGVASVKVPAGTFNECTKATSELEILFWSDTVEAYYHPSVPLSGMVRSVSKDDGSVIELVEFGLSGATSSI